MTNANPFLELGPCPIWCSDDHTGQEHPDDQKHTLDLSPIPTVIRNGPGLRRDGYPARAADLSLVAFQRLEDREIWVSLVSDEEGITVSFESAVRIHTELTRLLDTITKSAYPHRQ
ncbi:hypothetical protein G7066_08720 [Leucobacter coleopterorum]|uniref:Uncharacterized protein n=1 Tax=Leucobacter coleopterorum TaxID=2714933 RepID=A0ABX6JWI8_9MICO|nr:hypothetical protein [Leucobacter coleopterorum]QIM18673.1 hypothetical protein G7066_08720 [Leucobacter coleopterorum]